LRRRRLAAPPRHANRHGHGLRRPRAPARADPRFTADEAWEFAGRSASVHLETFPEADASLRNQALETEIAEWLKLRGVIAQSVEPARQQKLIGNALEAAVTLEIAGAKQLESMQGRESEIEEFFILSDLTLVAGPETKSNLVRTAYKKCARCWRHRAAVGTSAAHPDLCDRCEKVVEGISKPA
jgi:isoleucyl-tRNA synthetase